MSETKKYTCTCESCAREFDDKEYEYTSDKDKCILHCKKDDWYRIPDRKLKDYNIELPKDWSFSKDKIDFFWNELSNIIKKSTQENSKCNFNFVIFPQMVNSNIPKIKLLSFRKCIFLDYSDLSYFFSAKNLEINECIFYENVDIKDKICKEQFFFQRNHVIKNIKLFNIEFQGTSSFILNKFKKELTFDGVRFNDCAMFNNSEIGNLFFRNTFFRKESNFLDIELSNVGSRETTRIIKNSFEQQNNIIEANKFYALEMKEREKELEFNKEPFEWFVFKIHGLSSNHSQDWLLALYWILTLGFTFSLFNFYTLQVENKFIHFELSKVIGLFCLVFVGIFVDNICKKKGEKKSIFLLFYFYLLYTYETSDKFLTFFANTINPFSIMTGKDELTFGTLIFKIIIAYLIYQLIISIRQNTRRK
jgi:hypothetical protein